MLAPIAPYEAPALLGAHPTMTLNDVMDRLDQPRQPSRRALSGYLSRGLIEWACENNDWAAPVQRKFPLTDSADQSPPFQTHGIECAATAFISADETGSAISLTAIHLPGFTYSREWNKSGLVPEHYRIQAQWIMALAGTTVHGFVVLADKSGTIHWIDRDPAIITALESALELLAAHRAAGTRPPIDETRAASLTEAAATTSDPADPGDVDAAAANWIAAREANAAATTKATATAAAYESATNALKALIQPGASHDHGDLRIYHNARTGRLTEEKKDASFF